MRAPTPTEIARALGERTRLQLILSLVRMRLESGASAADVLSIVRTYTDPQSRPQPTETDIPDTKNEGTQCQ